MNKKTVQLRLGFLDKDAPAIQKIQIDNCTTRLLINLNNIKNKELLNDLNNDFKVNHSMDGKTIIESLGQDDVFSFQLKLEELSPDDERIKLFEKNQS